MAVVVVAGAFRSPWSVVGTVGEGFELIVCRLRGPLGLYLKESAGRWLAPVLFRLGAISEATTERGEREVSAGEREGVAKVDCVSLSDRLTKRVVVVVVVVVAARCAPQIGHQQVARSRSAALYRVSRPACHLLPPPLEATCWGRGRRRHQGDREEIVAALLGGSLR